MEIKFKSGDLYAVDYLNNKIENPEQLFRSGIVPIRATVPGNIELDLESAGLLKELFSGDNIISLENYENYDFWYDLRFDADRKFDKLVFDAVDTVAQVYLNGKFIGLCDNMFIPHEFSVNGVLECGENRLTVRIISAVLYAEQFDYDTGLWGNSYCAQSVHVRKAPHSYGWDICPRAMLGGIIGKVHLEDEVDTAIEDVYFHTLCIDYAGAHLRYSYDLKLSPAYYHKAYLDIKGVCGEKKFSTRQRIIFKHGIGEFTVSQDELALWQVKGYGTPSLYDITATVEDEKGKAICSKKLKLGIRTAGVNYSNDKDSKNFTVSVNGAPVMCMGTNWVPLDAFHSRDGERMGKALALLDEVNCNMVRCWGGNIYESEEFFDFCDEHGIMVWQDIIMACNTYPSESKFFDALEKELSVVIKRLRKHPSLIMYCGDNECDLGMFFNGINPENYKVTRDFLKTLLFRFDPFRPFLPSSPYFTADIVKSRDENALAENHLWGPRNNFKSSFYTENANVFISEIGYHGCPSAESIKKFISAERLWPWENDEWMAHQTVPGNEWTSEWNRNKLMVYQARELFGKEPQTLEELAFCSQVSQAEALKFFVETTRYKKWEKTGVIWWNLLDCWPQFSDAVVDYYFDKKLAYYYLTNLQGKICFCLKEPRAWDAEAVIVNDGDSDFTGEYKIIDALTGETLKSGRFNSEKNQNITVCALPLSKNITRYFILELDTDKGKFFNHYVNFGGAIKEDDYKAFLKKYAGYIGLPENFYTTGDGE